MINKLTNIRLIVVAFAEVWNCEEFKTSSGQGVEMWGCGAWRRRESRFIHHGPICKGALGCGVLQGNGSVGTNLDCASLHINLGCTRYQIDGTIIDMGTSKDN